MQDVLHALGDDHLDVKRSWVGSLTIGHSVIVLAKVSELVVGEGVLPQHLTFQLPKPPTTGATRILIENSPNKLIENFMKPCQSSSALSSSPCVALCQFE